jgi:FKBP-type peptidyl-prolyl cis-trans isomerase
MGRNGLIPVMLVIPLTLAGCACDCEVCRGAPREPALTQAPVETERIAVDEASLETLTGEPDDTSSPATGTASANQSAGGLLVEDLVSGEGPLVTRESAVIAIMTGRLEDGPVFHQSEEREGPWLVRNLIEGLAAGLEGMAGGGRRRITIPPELGYADQTIASEDTGEMLIPPGSTLVYEVLLIEVLGGAERPPLEDGPADGAQP